MESFYVCVILAAWFFSGLASFIYWWTQEFDFETSDIWFAILMAWIGPIAFLIGAVCHTPSGRPKVLIKRRG